MINDNNPKGPLVKVIKTEEMSKQIRNDEPYQEKVYLECGHWLYNTYGDRFIKRPIGELINCRTCGSKSNEQKKKI